MIGTILSLITGSRLGRWLSAVLMSLAILSGAFLYGKQTQKQAHRVDDLRDYKKTREIIDEVEPSSDRDAAIERLRDNGVIR